MLSRIVVLIALTWITLELYTKKHSALVDNGVYFYRRLEYKMNVNPMFYTTSRQFNMGVCSSKAGPRCLIKNPIESFTNNPVLGSMTAEQNASYTKAELTAAAQSPYMEKYLREQIRLIFLPTEQAKDFDKVMQPYYE